jgi:hypothetical protein
MIEHRQLGRDRDRMRVRHVHRAGAELDVLGVVGQRRQKDRAGGDVLRLVGGVLAAQSDREAELVGQDESFAILAQRRPPILVQGMDRHGEKAKIHGIPRQRGAISRHPNGPGGGRRINI